MGGGTEHRERLTVLRLLRASLIISAVVLLGAAAWMLVTGELFGALCLFVTFLALAAPPRSPWADGRELERYRRKHDIDRANWSSRL